MLTLSKQSDYALIILSQLKGKKEYIPLSVLVDKSNLPKRFLARIAATMVSNKLLISREGRVGGYQLAPSIESMSFYDFLTIFEKNLGFLDCLKHSKKCKYQKVCHHRKGIQTKLNEIVLRELKRTKLMELFP